MWGRSEFAVITTCPNCRQTGAVVWEETDAEHRELGPCRKLALLSGGFHAEEGRTESGDPVIVCDNCDHMLLD